MNNNIDNEIDKAITYYVTGYLDKAEKIYKKILKKHPENHRVMNLLGLLKNKKGKRYSAKKYIRDAILLSPETPSYYNNLGEVFRSESNIADAIDSYNKAISINPGYAQAYNNIGCVYIEIGKIDDAIRNYKLAIENSSGYVDAYINLGNAYGQRCDIKMSIDALYKAISIDQNSALAEFGLANILKKTGNFDEAVIHYRKAINNDGEHIDSYNNLANLLKEQGKLTEAIELYRSAIEVQEDYLLAYKGLGSALSEIGNVRDALVTYRKGLSIDRSNVAIMSSIVWIKRKLCAWSEMGVLEENINKLFPWDGQDDLGTPFSALSRTDSIEQNYIIATRYSKNIKNNIIAQKQLFKFNKVRGNDHKIRIGYLSCDLRDHAISHLMLGVFREHNKANFEVYVYSYGMDDGSSYRKSIMEYSDMFLDISSMSNISAAKKINDDGVQVLVDLNGYTRDARIEICALRPAPIQVTYLGFPGTSGADFFDYIITDRVVSPIEHEAFYSEKFAYLPYAYQANDNKQRISNQNFSREQFGLPNNSFVFCSFTQNYKIDPVFFDVWMELLRGVDDSILWLYERNEETIKNITFECENRGINAERIFFADSMPKEEHLRRIQLADVVLDTRLYNGHTTTSDALWAGVPVVAMEGKHFASRVSSSLLQAIGLGELVAGSVDEYKLIALELAKDRVKLNSIRGKLKANRDVTPLFDTTKFVSNLEVLYGIMQDRFENGCPVSHIDDI